MVTKLSAQAVTLREKMRGGEGTVALAGLIPDLPGNCRLFSRIVLERGVSIGYHVHENETELFAFVSGHGRANDNGTWIDVQAGDAMATPSGSGHAVENTGNEPLVIIAAIVKD